MTSAKSVAAWQKQLERTFLSNPQALQLVKHEETRAAEALRSSLRGHWVLMDSFHTFFAEAIRKALSTVGGESTQSEEWWTGLLEFITSFRSWRAAEITFRSGYPAAGFGLLRDLKDRAIFVSAVGQGLTTFRSVLGFEGLEAPPDEVLGRIKRQRKQEEWRVKDRMTGKDCGLSSETRRELGEWEEMFHLEVHGARLSQTDLVPWMQGDEHLTIGPRESSGAEYVNRAAEVGWMWTRVLPLLQGEADFGKTWSANWRTLDDSFRFMVTSLKDPEKPTLTTLVEAIVEFVETRFVFEASSRFPSP